MIFFFGWYCLLISTNLRIFQVSFCYYFWLILLWLKNIFYMIWILLHLRSFILKTRIPSILVNVFQEPEENMSPALEWSSRDLNQVIHWQHCVSHLFLFNCSDQFLFRWLLEKGYSALNGMRGLQTWHPGSEKWEEPWVISEIYIWRGDTTPHTG